MNVYDIEVDGIDEVVSVVAENMGHAERYYLIKHPMATIRVIRLHSEEAIIAKEEKE
jgi:hypothetical protein